LVSSIPEAYFENIFLSLRRYFTPASTFSSGSKKLLILYFAAVEGIIESGVIVARMIKSNSSAEIPDFSRSCLATSVAKSPVDSVLEI